MERTTQRILAIVIVAVIAVGSVIGVFIVLTLPVAAVGWVTPGVSGVPEDRMIKIGILSAMYDVQGQGNWEGAYLAARDINTNGGVVINNSQDADTPNGTYYIALKAQDTDEANPNFLTSRGVAAAENIIHVDGAQFIIGGFRTEVANAYLEVAMQYKIPFMITGSATSSLTEKVANDYDTYKYLFRCMPNNESYLAGAEVGFLVYLKAALLAGGKNMTKVAIIREDIAWTVQMAAILGGALGALANMTVVYNQAFPLTADETTFTSMFNSIDALGTHLTIPLTSAGAGIHMTSAYSSVKPDSLLCGINVVSQDFGYWDDTAGKCEYEITMVPSIRTNITDRLIPFWDNYTALWGHEPVCYTAFGAYDAVNIYAEAIAMNQSLDADDVVSGIETNTAANPRDALTGNGAFTHINDGFSGAHDIVGGYGFGTPQFVQWYDGGLVGINCPTQYPILSGFGNVILPDWFPAGWAT